MSYRSSLRFSHGLFPFLVAAGERELGVGENNSGDKPLPGKNMPLPGAPFVNATIFERASVKY